MAHYSGVGWATMRTSFLILLVMLLPGVAGAECDDWRARLRRGDSERSAMARIAALDCKAGSAEIRARFPDTPYRREALEAIKRLGKSGDGVAMVRSALLDKEVGEAARALVVDWRLDEMKGELERLIRSPRALLQRNDLLAARLALGSAEDTLETLIWVSAQGGSKGTRSAVRALGTIDWRKRTSAEGERAARALLFAVFARGADSGRAAAEARATLRRIGPIATPALLEAFTGRNEALNAWADRSGIARWRVVGGHKLIELLWDVGGPGAARAIMTAMLRTPSPPSSVRRNLLRAGALAMGTLVNDAVIPDALPVLSSGAVDPLVRSEVARALALMGTPAAEGALWAAFRAGDEVAVSSRARLAVLKKQLRSAGAPAADSAVVAEHDALVDDLLALNRKKVALAPHLGLALRSANADAFQREVLHAGLTVGDEGRAAASLRLVRRCREDATCYAATVASGLGQLAEIDKGLRAARRALSGARIEVGRRLDAVELPLQIAEAKRAAPATLDALYAKAAKVFAGVPAWKSAREQVEAAQGRAYQLHKAALAVSVAAQAPDGAVEALAALLPETVRRPTDLSSLCLQALGRLAQRAHLPLLLKLHAALYPAWVRPDRRARYETYWTLAISRIIARVQQRP